MNKINRKSFEDNELKIVEDPHHGGFMLWGWDGESLWTKPKTISKKWTLVKRIHATPARVSAILRLTNGIGLMNIKFKKGSEF